MDDFTEEEWVTFISQYEPAIHKPMPKCPVCNGSLIVTYLPDDAIVINCKDCNIEWTKKELFFMAQIKKLEKQRSVVRYISGRCE